MKIIYRKADPNDPLVKAFAEPPSIASEAEFRKLMIVEELLTLMAEKGISRGELAKRMDVQPSRVTSMLTGANNFTIETLVRAGRAVGADIELHFVPMEKGETQTQAPSRTVYPTGKKLKSSPASHVLKPAKGKSGSIASKSLNPDGSIHRVAEDPTPYRTKRKSR